MKNNIIALFMLFLFSINKVNAIEIYNKNNNKLDINAKINIRHSISNAKGNSGIKIDDIDNSRVRFGVKGDKQIIDDLIGFVNFEYETKINKGEDNNIVKNRLSYIGLKFVDLSSIDYGRNYGIIYDISSWTDVLPIWGGDSISQTDTYMTGRNRNLLTYRNKNGFGYIKGLNLALQYQAKNIENNNNIDLYYRDNCEGYGISSTYSIGNGLTLGGSYFNSIRPEMQKIKDFAYDSNAQAWNIGSKLDRNNLYFAAMYGEALNVSHFGKTNYIANKTKNTEFVVQYLFDSGLKPSFAFIKSKCKNLDIYDNKNILKYISIGSYYVFNKNIYMVVDYKINLLKNTDFIKEMSINTDNLIGLGFSYKI
ncbi:porin [Candidatus Providencia siddallii]|uniref:Outer membrane porin F n=1 Tax=Candidatus Providencia siddallii TaxID=1715285 RepID=A0ABM9NPK5_9GAMM